LFYTGSGFPAEYRNSAFVALHGSINRSTLSGYSVVRVPFKNGKPAGPADVFLSGFIARDDDEKEAWGRPVGLLQLKDGSLLVSDDAGNRVWRVSYRQPWSDGRRSMALSCRAQLRQAVAIDETRVHFANPGARDRLAHVVRPDAAARDNLDSPAGLTHERSDRCRPLSRRRRAAARQRTRNPGVDQRF